MGWRALESGLRDSVASNLCLSETPVFWVLMFRLCGHEKNWRLILCWNPSLKCSLEVIVVVSLAMQMIVQTSVTEAALEHCDLIFCFFFIYCVFAYLLRIYY